MNALLYADFETLTDVETSVPSIGPDDVLLKVAACGICGSELESFKHLSVRRKPPLILGHEFCGVIHEVGPNVTGFHRGDRVVSNSLVTCGECPSCRRGNEHLCQHRQLFGMHRPGAFAEFVAVPARSLIVWPDHLPAEIACLAEPLANGVHMVQLTRDVAPRMVLVIGAGPIGLLAQQAFQALTGAHVVVVDTNDDRIAIAARIQAFRIANPRSVDVVALMRELTAGEGADVVIDAVGSEITKRQSLQAVRPGGAVVWIGLGQDEIRLASYALTIPEVRLHGTYGARVTDLQTAIALLAAGKIETQSWVKLAPLRGGQALFNDMLAAQGDNVKGVLLP